MKRTSLIAALLIGTAVLAQAAWNPTKPTNFFNTIRLYSLAEANFPDAGMSTPGALIYGTTRNEVYFTSGLEWLRLAPREYTGTLSYDFPALSSNALEASCAQTFTATVTGATLGSRCEVATNLGMDGGSALALEAVLTCRAVTNGAVGKLCVHFTDGGTYNLHDAGFYFTVTVR